jgi:hypothetical protein
MNTNPEWKLVPVEPTAEMWAAVNNLDDQMAAGGYDGKGASIEQAWNCLVETAPEAPPLTVVLDPDPRGVSVGVYQGSRCTYNGAHPIPTGATGEDDIVQRLRDNADLDAAEDGNPAVIRLEREAANEIERLRRALADAPAAGDALDAARWRLAVADCILVLRGDAALGRAEWDSKLDKLAMTKGAK